MTSEPKPLTKEDIHTQKMFYDADTQKIIPVVLVPDLQSALQGLLNDNKKAIEATALSEDKFQCGVRAGLFEDRERIWKWLGAALKR